MNEHEREFIDEHEQYLQKVLVIIVKNLRIVS